MNTFLKLLNIAQGNNMGNFANFYDRKINKNYLIITTIQKGSHQ